MTSSNALRGAVQQHAPKSLMGMQERLFSIWFNSFIYNQIWEDPKVDLMALDLKPDSHVLTIASGGCNILNYLTQSPASITALDLNPYHLALTRLKIAALAHLPDHEHFYQFFGYAQGESNIAAYYQYIQAHLDPELDHFWTARSLLGACRLDMFAKGLYRHTRFGYFMRFLHAIARLSKAKPERLLTATTLAEQQQIFVEHIEPFFDKGMVRLLGKLPMSVYSLGIPPQQYKAMQADGNLIEQYRERVKRLVCQFPIQDNYFAWQAFGHHYDHEHRWAIPMYLDKLNYRKIQQQLHKVDTQFGSVLDFLRKKPANSLDRFVLLDAQDWMSDAVLVELWTEIMRVAKPQSRIIFRTAAEESPLTQVLPAALLRNFVYDKAQSQRLFQQDRSAIYGGFHLYSKR